MSTPPVADHLLRQAVELMAIHGSQVKASQAAGISRGAFQQRLRMARERGINAAPTSPIVVPAPAEPVDALEKRRLRDEVSRLRSANTDLERRAALAEDIRASVLGLMDAPLKPRLTLPQRPEDHSGGRTVIAHLTDVHYGETVSLHEMDGANRYDAAIARARIGRFFSKIASLCTEHWSGPAPDEIILGLGGDLVSGNIHAELAETNAPAVPATVREMGEIIAGGIGLLRQSIGCPVRVYTVPGNHGRLTLKPHSKGRAAMSLDLLATDFAEACVRGAGITDVTFYRTDSPDAYFSTYAWNWLLTHGDTMGSKGGQGFIGPAATIVRGHRKLVDTAWRSGRAIHYVLTGHLHTTLRTPFGWSGGSVVGYGEYARDLRADPEPARQNMLVVHEKRGVIGHQELFLGHPSEGSHYAGPAIVVRPYADFESV